MAAFERGGDVYEGEALSDPLHGESGLSSMLLRLLGGSMALSSMGIWLVPGSFEDAEFALLRIGVSVVLLGVGLALTTCNKST